MIRTFFGSVISKGFCFSLLTAGITLSVFQSSHGQTVSTPIVGFTKTTLNASSDTIITPQVHRPSEYSSTVSSITVSANTSDVSFSGGSLTASQFKYVSNSQPKTYFLLITSGPRAGAFYTVNDNTTTSLTIDNNGDVGLATALAAGTSFEVRPYWTLNTLFPPADVNSSFIASTSTLPAGRRTQILLPNTTGTGVNRAPNRTYYYLTSLGDWVLSSATSVKAGDTAILPNEYLILRNSGTGSTALSHTQTGSVLASKIEYGLATSAAGATDTYISLPRPTDMKLSELGLDTNSFMNSTSTLPGGRRDQLLVVSGTGSGINRAASVTYYKTSSGWYNSSGVLADHVIPAGSAIILRKFRADGNDKLFVNNPNY